MEPTLEPWSEPLMQAIHVSKGLGHPTLPNISFLIHKVQLVKPVDYSRVQMSPSPVLPTEPSDERTSYPAKHESKTELQQRGVLGTVGTMSRA